MTVTMRLGRVSMFQTIFHNNRTSSKYLYANSLLNGHDSQFENKRHHSNQYHYSSERGINWKTLISTVVAGGAVGGY